MSNNVHRNVVWPIMVYDPPKQEDQFQDVTNTVNGLF